MQRYINFYMEDEKMIKVECVGDINANSGQFLNDLTKGGERECRPLRLVRPQVRSP